MEKNSELKKIRVDVDQSLNGVKWMKRAKRRKIKVTFLSFSNLILILIIGVLLT
tara:strand:- start:287 stop:448 length:162 start_codon:yes stop_codon:yes gene_type:complete